jgi:hypothetical protein
MWVSKKVEEVHAYDKVGKILETSMEPIEEEEIGKF